MGRADAPSELQVPRGGRTRRTRRCPVGAEGVGDGEVEFRVWAPGHRLEVVLLEPDGRTVREVVPAEGDGEGYATATAHARPGDLYALRLDGETLLPDPASRFQPRGPHGPSAVVDPDAFAWSDGDWTGPDLEDQVLYEMHVGTFTREGTWSAAQAHLEGLAELGVTTIEMMPVCEAGGSFGWGYDGVDLFAPSHLYGTPDDLRRFVDAAHRLGLSVILDVVYNHLGPDGNYLRSFSPAYFTDRYPNEWGDAVNFDGEDAGPVREFFAANARYWVDEFHADGYRFDATQQMFDASPEHILRRLVRETRETAAAAGRRALTVVENEPQDAILLRPPERGGLGADACWNDDFHRAAVVALTGRREAYYSDYAGTPQELLSAVRHGFLYQGQWYGWQGKPRGRPARDLPSNRFVHFLENHDQVANSLDGARLHQRVAPGAHRAMTALLLLSPQVPMLFQGQEFGSDRPFLYFADHEAALGGAVRQGRHDFLSQFPSIAGVRAGLHDPVDPDLVLLCALPGGAVRRSGPQYALHRDLLRLRRRDPVFSQRATAAVDGAVLGAEALVLRWDVGGDARLVLVNLGGDWDGAPLSEPLLAPLEGRPWTLLWDSEEPRYGGGGGPACDFQSRWQLPARSAAVLAPTGEGADGAEDRP